MNKWGIKCYVKLCNDPIELNPKSWSNVTSSGALMLFFSFSNGQLEHDFIIIYSMFICISTMGRGAILFTCMVIFIYGLCSTSLLWNPFPSSQFDSKFVIELLEFPSYFWVQYVASHLSLKSAYWFDGTGRNRGLPLPPDLTISDN